jgi:hypothetical protein
MSKLARRVGREWVAARDADVQTFRADELTPQYAQHPEVATVMVDGGRVQTRDEDSGKGASDPCWREVKVACCQSISSHAATRRGVDLRSRDRATFEGMARFRLPGTASDGPGLCEGAVASQRLPARRPQTAAGRHDLSVSARLGPVPADARKPALEAPDVRRLRCRIILMACRKGRHRKPSGWQVHPGRSPLRSIDDVEVRRGFLAVWALAATVRATGIKYSFGTVSSSLHSEEN